jgi:hypothetical protein
MELAYLFTLADQHAKEHTPPAAKCHVEGIGLGKRDWFHQLVGDLFIGQ